MQKYIFSFLALFITFSLTAQDFRQAKWNMSKPEIKKLEKGTPKDQGDSLIFEQEMGGLNWNIIYYFHNNKLYQAKYLLKENMSFKNEYVYLYFQLMDMLMGKYGQPIKNHSIWRNERFKGEMEHVGLAVEKGYLVYLSYYGNKETLIQLLLHRDPQDDEIDLSITYMERKQKTIFRGKDYDEVFQNL